MFAVSKVGDLTSSYKEVIVLVAYFAATSVITNKSFYNLTPVYCGG